MIDTLTTNTGRSLDEWYAVLDSTGLEKRGELMGHGNQEHGVSHANGIVLQYRARGTSSVDGYLVDAQYTGAWSGPRPIYDALVAKVLTFEGDVEVAPKKGSVSLRRSTQFALIEPASAKRLRLGINLKVTPPTERRLAGCARTR